MRNLIIVFVFSELTWLIITFFLKKACCRFQSFQLSQEEDVDDWELPSRPIDTQPLPKSVLVHLAVFVDDAAS